MNIILLDKENVKEINDIEVIEDTKLYIVNLDSNYKVNINLLDNTKLEVFDFNLSNKSVEFIINQNNNTSFIYNHSFKINGDYNLNMVANILGNDNTNKINIYGISNGDAKLIVDGIVKNGTKNNILDENIKVLTIGGKCFTRPMMHINVKECIANHNTAISNVRDDEVFYLMSKGLDKDTSIKLISDGYLYGLFKNEEEFYNKIDKEG